MDTLVCVKAVVREPPRLRDATGTPVFEWPRSAPLALNESDAYAVDEAVRLRKQHGGRVRAVTVGALAAQDVLYTALAKGADDALRVDATPEDAHGVARLLAAVARRDGYDLVLTGVESWDGLSSAVGPMLAAELDWPFASAVSAIQTDRDEAEDEARALVTREQGGGFFQTLEMPLPAVLSVQSGICRLRYPPTIRVLQARKRPPRSESPRALGVELAEPVVRRVAASAPRREREVELLGGEPAEIASALADRIEGTLRPS